MKQSWGCIGVDTETVETVDASAVQVFVPDDVLSIQAYLLWEKAGRPDGADYSQQARDEIHLQLKSGRSLKVCC
jgi:hypothetical protein